MGESFIRFRVYAVNELAKQQDMQIQQGNEIFILGYPLGFSHFLRTPIWKRGSIASEPNLEDLHARGRVIVDATTRSGMSGAPVIMRAKTHYLSVDGTVKEKANASRWLGIYSSRPNLPASPSLIEEDRRAEVGYFIKLGFVNQTVMQGVRGPRIGEMP